MSEGVPRPAKKRSQVTDASPEPLAKKIKTISHDASSPSIGRLSDCINGSESGLTSSGSSELSQRSLLACDSHSVHSAGDGECNSGVSSTWSEESSASESSSSGHDDEESESNDSETQPIIDDPISVPHLAAPLKPPIRFLNDSGLRHRLSSFLPALKRANEALERDLAAGKVKSAEIANEDIEKEQWKGPYIEMDLGLGVLEEKGGDISETSSGGGHGARSEDGVAHPPSELRACSQQEEHVMRKLMGNKSKIAKPSIEEMD